MFHCDTSQSEGTCLLSIFLAKSTLFPYVSFHRFETYLCSLLGEFRRGLRYMPSKTSVLVVVAAVVSEFRSKYSVHRFVVLFLMQHFPTK